MGSPIEAQGGFTPGSDDRSLGQFFFELGYGACWADAFMADPKLPQHFPLSDAAVERAWDVLPMCQDTPEDCAEFDRRKALADASPDLLEACSNWITYLDSPVSHEEVGALEEADMLAAMRAAIAKATGQ